ncbi:MAG: hypothetical protein AAGE80_00405 [Pseudomonadota bacterium]
MDEISIAGLLVLTFKLGVFGLLVLHARQARRTADEARAEQAAAREAEEKAREVKALPEPMREAA